MRKHRTEVGHAVESSYAQGMKNHKSERHHWWPEAVSERWKDAEGCVNWLAPSGEVKRAPPKNFGVIGNGHFIKLGNDPSEPTPWDENFEREFERADSAFPGVIDWLESLDRTMGVDPRRIESRYLPQPASDIQLVELTESIVSLAVRSPMNRQSACGLAEHFRGPLPARERNSIIGANIRHTQRAVSDAIRSRAKFCVIFSPEKELVFGDGFYSTVRSPGEHLMNPRILAPITPNLAVLIARPMSYAVEPRLTTLVATSADTDALNHAVQVYAKDAIFYRSQAPTVTDAFATGQHCVYSNPGHPIDSFVHSLPGVPPRDTSMDELFAKLERS